MSNYFLTQTNKLGMTLVEYNTLKRYFSGIDSIKYAYQKYLDKVPLQELIRKPLCQLEHHKILVKGDSLIFSKNLPREPIKENVNPKRGSVVFKEKKFSNQNFWEQLLSNSTKLLNKGYIINLYSEIGEQGLIAGSVLLNELKKNYEQQSQDRLKFNITTGAKLDYDFKDFNDYDSSVSKMASNNVVCIFSYNTLSSSDFNKAKFESLLDECFIKNNLVILTSKKELKIQGREVINIAFSDSIKKETELLEQLFG